MLLSFYLFSLAPVLFFLILSIATKQREIVHRSLTLVALLHLFCLILWQGPLAFSLLVAVIFILGVYELSGHYGINRAMILVPSLVTFALTYQFPRPFSMFFRYPFCYSWLYAPSGAVRNGPVILFSLSCSCSSYSSRVPTF